MNCSMVQVGLKVYIGIEIDVAASEGLYTTYGKGYRLKRIIGEFYFKS